MSHVGEDRILPRLLVNGHLLPQQAHGHLLPQGHEHLLQVHEGLLQVCEEQVHEDLHGHLLQPVHARLLQVRVHLLPVHVYLLQVHEGLLPACHDLPLVQHLHDLRLAQVHGDLHEHP